MPRPRKLLLIVLIAPLVLLTASLTAFRVASAWRESRTGAEAAPATGHFISAAGLQIFIQESGPSNGPAVFLVHGTGAWSDIWQETMAALAGAGYHAIAIDLPPFGFSERPSPASYSDSAQAARINAVLDALNLESVTLVGHSIGARPTVEAALARPGRFRLLVLVDAALDPKEVPDQGRPGILARAVLSPRWVRTPLVAATATNPLLTRRLYQKLIFDPADATDAQVAMVQRQFQVRGTTAAVGDWIAEIALGTSPARNQRRSSYAVLTMPSCLIWGREDSVTPLPRGQALAELLPHATLAVLEKTGHIPAVEDAPAFNTALLGFLASHQPESLTGQAGLQP
ncbi:MAG TPA: alpha/beta hydrolase [Gemmatimonadales bacterium]|nr:alpha/beta hydrolase [Gemmatimonadales bacterium]